MTSAIGLSRTDPSTLTRLCHADDVPLNGVKQVVPAGSETEYAVYQLSDGYYCSDDICTHGLVSLSNGDVDDGQIFCPLHGGAFDIRTGAPTELPCRLRLKTYAVQRIGDDLFADLSAPLHR